MKIGKGHTLAYLILLQYKPYSTNENSSEKVMQNISATLSETEVEMLPAGIKMIFLDTTRPC